MAHAGFEKSNVLRAKGQRLIPGGAHTYAKGDDQYPLLAPGHIVRGKGCRAWDADGNEYIEYGMGNRAVTLGHAYEPVLAAVRGAGKRREFHAPGGDRAAAAEKFLSMIPNAEMVKFSKDGSDATSGRQNRARLYRPRHHRDLR
ncbi:MAG: aminotransferase class III-fold pyridoxal phosphate-dependent enzyme [Hyphomonadaceae bacterium]